MNEKCTRVLSVMRESLECYIILTTEKCTQLDSWRRAKGVKDAFSFLHIGRFGTARIMIWAILTAGHRTMVVARTSGSSVLCDGYNA
jgi:hypothetical protein